MRHSWAERKTVGDELEQRIYRELLLRGWTVALTGLGTLPEQIRRALARTDSRRRWEPDLIAALGSAIALIDAKSAMRGDDALSYTISRKALSAHLRLGAEEDLPVYYVFGNLGVATPAEVMQICGLSTLRDAGSYVSIPAGAPRPFDEVFGGAPLARVPVAA